MEKSQKIVITGAAGLVGQNLIILLKEQGYTNLVAIDKHEYNTAMLRQLHPEVQIILDDLADPQPATAAAFAGAAVLVQLHAQITGKTREIFDRNNITATAQVLDMARQYQIPYIVHISSSVVISRAGDAYTDTKKAQEKMVVESGIPAVVLRPTLMYGWFDRKHLGWLSRFMAKVPLYPIPGNGQYLRQPLYVRDLCAVILSAIETSHSGEIHNIVGRENVMFIDIIRTIKRIKKLHTLIICIPYGFFRFLLKTYALFSKNPPFTADQLKALCAGDKFPLVPWWETFGTTPTSFTEAMTETLTDPRYKKYVLKR